MCTNSGGSIPRIMVFRPSLEEMKDFPAYINYMESQGANKAGLAKIIPPKEWCPRAAGYDSIDLIIPAPISQEVHGRQGLYQQINIQKKSILVKDFKVLAESEKYRTPTHFDYEDLERKYWRNITFNSPIYGADVSGSLYDLHVKEFNINHLDSVLDMVNEDYGIRIEGVNTAYLYFGMWKTTFPWHTEDMDLYSINYLHFGAPKSWYAIPPEHGRRLERLATGFFPGNSKSCAAFLRHKMTIISPAVLKQYSIPFNKITQEPGEFMVTFPFGYHAGFNHGFNCAESTNFAMPRWVEYGKRALQCSCRKDGVKISMDVFVRKFQPERYDLWKMGKDVGVHPEDPTRAYAAPPPTKMELSACARAEERRRYKTISDTAVSKRHPISHFDEKDGVCSNEDVQSDDTEIYDVDEIMPETDKKKKQKKKKEQTGVMGTVKEKVKRKIKKEPKIDKVKIKKKIKKEFGDSPPQLTPFYMADEFVKSHSPVKLIISKKRVPSTTSDADITEFEVKEASPPVHSNSPPNIEPSVMVIPSLNDNSKLMALAHLAGNVDFRMNVSQHLPTGKKVKEISGLQTATYDTHSANLGFTLPQRVSLVKSSDNSTPKVLTKTVNVPAIQNQTYVLHSNLLDRSMVRVPSTNEQELGGTNNPGVVMSQTVTGTSNGSVWHQKKNIPVFVPFSNNSADSFQQAFMQAMSIKPTTSILKNHVRDEKLFIETQAHTVVTSSPSFINQTSVNQRTDFTKSLQKETCLYESDYLPQAAHMHQHQKLHKMLHDYARLENAESTPDVLNLSKKSSSPEDLMEDWAKALSKLWVFNAPDFEAEKAFNLSTSIIEPHCSICTVFKALRKNVTCDKIQLPSSSVVLMPSSVFATSTMNQFVLDNNPLLSPDGTAPLLQCSKCCVCVHATCYGVTEDQIVDDWKCLRCKKDALEAICCLCPLRGGALKLTLDGRWAHILCAALVPGAFFGSILTKEPIDLSKIKQARLKLSCLYCYKFVPKGNGVCIQCSSGKCSLSFHVSCAHAAGVTFETSNWPTPIYITCTRHTTFKREGARSFTDVKIGDKAIAKHKNKRYYKCEVQRIDKHDFYAVDFEDGSFSENLFPQDIISHNCLELGPPKINEPVNVQWTDGNRYPAVFKGTKTQVMYTVEFENGSQLQLRREDFYTADEELPKRVLSRMSSATDGQHTDIFDDREVDGKRIRFVNTKYLSSEVVPM